MDDDLGKKPEYDYYQGFLQMKALIYLKRILQFFNYSKNERDYGHSYRYFCGI